MINKKEYPWITLQMLPAKVKEKQLVETWQRIASSPNALLKALWRGRHWAWGPNRRRAIKEESISINRDRVNN